MNETGIALTVIGAGLAFVVCFNFALGTMDRKRIVRHIEMRGGRMLRARWSPFGPGWLGDRSDRIYDVNYLDSQGHRRNAFCKTNWFGGVYFSGDAIIQNDSDGAAAKNATQLSLEDENRRLREELERLKQGQR